MSESVVLNIGGMTCINCQNRIEEALCRTEGVLNAAVSFKDGTARIDYDGSLISLKRIEAVITELDYEVLSDKGGAKFDLVNSLSLLVIIIALYITLQTLGILNRLVPKNLADAGMGYQMLFVTGLVTSVHCIAMCGGIGLSQSLPAEKSNTAGGSFGALLPSFFYNLGRVCSYTLTGFILGLVGAAAGLNSDIGISAVLQGLLKIAAGLFMVVMGINMLGIFPWLRGFNLRPPKFLTRLAGVGVRASSRPFAVGLLNGLMPCGPLQSMWLVALAAGSPLSGALSMLMFGLGTAPLMLGLGSIVSALGKRFTAQVMRVGAVLVVVLGLSMLSQGGALSGLLPLELLLYLIIAFSVSGVILSLPSGNMRVRYALGAAAVGVVAITFALWGARGRLMNGGKPRRTGS